MRHQEQIRCRISFEETAHAESHRARFRRAIRTAHRKARARPARVFGNHALRRAGRRDSSRRAFGHHPFRRPRQRVRRRCAAGRPCRLRPWRSRSWLLLWPANHGQDTRRRRRPHRGWRIRPGDHNARLPFPFARRHARRADRMDEPSRLGCEGARWLHHHIQHRRVPGCFDGMRRAQPLRHPIPPRSAPHHLRHADAFQLPVRHLRA